MLSFKIQFISVCLLRMRDKMKPMINRLIQTFSRNVDDRWFQVTETDRWYLMGFLPFTGQINLEENELVEGDEQQGTWVSSFELTLYHS